MKYSVRPDAELLLYLSIQMFIISLIIIALVTFQNSTNPLWITLAFLPFTIAQIIPSAILYPLCLNFIPQAKGKVSALIQGLRLIFSALSLQLAGYFYSGSFRSLGVIIILFMLMIVITLFFVVKNRSLMSTVAE